MRTIIDLPNEQIQALSRLVEQEKVSRAELIRRAVHEYIKRYQVPDDDAFGAWKNRQQDGLEYQRQLRDEWSS